MSDWYSKAREKKLYIVRGLPGSGKSTLSNDLGEDGSVFSTDDFFKSENGRYEFNPEMISDAHDWNIERAIEAMNKGVTPIVIDNTVIQAWEAKPYVTAALDKGYEVEIVETGIEEDPVELSQRNLHDVPLETIERMMDRWEENITIQDVIESKPPYEEDFDQGEPGQWQ